ncbi:AAA family ATPase [Plasticicumulans sp.]|uniref:AAA family ATPase n=1 Tax=Plasticicumulans sp. TaxID=2307179 RepID=UPI003932C76E
MTRASVSIIEAIDAQTDSQLQADSHFSAAGHKWSACQKDALILALASRRPLLIRGEAGSGKSQIARAAAHVLGSGTPLMEVIHPRFEALDLLWRLDAVERLADAQLHRLDKTNKKYVKRGRLWDAIELANQGGPLPVLLIDEIDKADSDVPNALLDVLGNRSFSVPPLGHRTVRCTGQLPLIIITTNEERELPAAFVRRCAVLNLNPPTDDHSLLTWLIERGKAHQHLLVENNIRKLAAEQVLSDRNAAIATGHAKVGLAEYIDLLEALHDLTCHLAEPARNQQQIYWLERLSAYALIKGADQSQQRPAVKRTA